MARGNDRRACWQRIAAASVGNLLRARADGEGGLALPPVDRCIYGERFTEGCCHEWKVLCRHPERRGNAYGRRECRNCPLRKPTEDVRIGAVVTAFNEGEEVRETLRSLATGVRRADLRVILVDDGSSDGSCRGPQLDRAPLYVARNGEPRGVGRSRNAGWAIARQLGCDVVTFHDAHMRFPPGVLESLAAKALRTGAVCSAASHGLPSRGKLRGCWLHLSPGYALQPKWQTGEQARRALGVEELPEWWRVPCMMGACYVMARRTAGRLEAATGLLWEDVAGRWGFSEEALSVKAFLLDVPILQSRDLACGHLYRSTNPVPHAVREVWRNRARCTARLLGRDVFDRRFRPWCEAKLGRAEVERILDPLPEGVGGAVRSPEEVFTHLLGIGAPVTDPHPCHRWLPEVRTACESLARERTGGEGVRVLQWRPGEATALVCRLLPRAEVMTIEVPGPRSEAWRPYCAAEGVNLTEVGLQHGYASWPKDHGWGRFDLVLVGGEMQEACLSTARSLARPDAIILRNPTADRKLIEHGALKEERKALTLPEPKIGPAGAPAGRTTSRGRRGAAVTVCLLNWSRPENIGPVLDSIAAQTVPACVALWNNGRPLYFGPDERPIAEHPLVDLVVRSGENLGCFPRWWLAGRAGTEFVCSLDDDLKLADERVLEDALAACRELRPDGIVGFFGWQSREGRGYRAGRHVNGSARDVPVDLIKGRFMLFRTDLLERVPLRPPAELVGKVDPFRADDVYLSLCISRGRPGHHLVPGALGRRWREVGRQDGRALASHPDHYAARGRAVRALLDHFGKGDRDAVRQGASSVT